MTRANVYAGPAGFWLIRGGPQDLALGYVAPGVGADPLGEYTELPIAIQDRSFNVDGSLFYPDSQFFFEGLDDPPSEPYLDIPYTPDLACGEFASDVSPIWNSEFFGNMMVVNGRTWPYLEVEQRALSVALPDLEAGQYLGPEEPFFGGIPGIDLDQADLASTGQVLSWPRPRVSHAWSRSTASAGGISL
jgi:hypothetical protein